MKNPYDPANSNFAQSPEFEKGRVEKYPGARFFSSALLFIALVPVLFWTGVFAAWNADDKRLAYGFYFLLVLILGGVLFAHKAPAAIAHWRRCLVLLFASLLTLASVNWFVLAPRAEARAEKTEVDLQQSKKKVPREVAEGMRSNSTAVIILTYFISVAAAVAGVFFILLFLFVILLNR